ncbi:MAG: hypothetical protein D6675_12525 [Gemmatimonadetes bacterium]|nr:MAG: hypothetical protein D6675_12525 [Gemmatimonadota bacterium]
MAKYKYKIEFVNLFYQYLEIKVVKFRNSFIFNMLPLDKSFKSENLADILFTDSNLYPTLGSCPVEFFYLYW